MKKTISIVWGTDDVKEIRPDLMHEQAWEVLKQAEHYHDANIGISWEVLWMHAQDLFPVPTAK
jgi:hypothetical protein